MDVQINRYKISQSGQPELAQKFKEKFAYSEYESPRDFIQRFIQQYNIHDTFYVWSNRYNIGVCNFTEDNAIKLRIDPYHPTNIGAIQTFNIMYQDDSTEEIRKNPALLFNYKINIYNWTSAEKPNEPIKYATIDRFDTVISIYQKISDRFNKSNQMPYIWLTDKDGKEIAPFGFGIEQPRWTGYHINPWKARMPNLKKEREYDPIPHIHYHPTNVPQGYIQHDLNVVFPDYFSGAGERETLVFNPYYFQYFPICSTPVAPVFPPIFVSHKGAIKVVEGIYPDDSYLTAMYKIAAAFGKEKLPLLFTKPGEPIGIAPRITIPREVFKSAFTDYARLQVTPSAAPTVNIVNGNFKYTQYLNALFPEDFKEQNPNFLAHFFIDYDARELEKINKIDTVIKKLLYKKKIADHYKLVAGSCTYNLLVYEGHIKAIQEGQMTFADIFDTVPTSPEIPMIQWIDDRGRVIYKLFKKHDISEHIFKKWTDKENIRKRHGEEEEQRNYCVNLYGMIPKMSDGYFVVSFRESGIFTISYNIGKREQVNYMTIYEHQKWLITRLNQHLAFKLKSYLNQIELSTDLKLINNKLTIDMVLKRFKEYAGTVFKPDTLTKVNMSPNQNKPTYKVIGVFLRSGANFALKIDNVIDQIEISIENAQTMPDIRRSMHYIRSILLLHPVKAEEEARAAPATPTVAATPAAATTAAAGEFETPEEQQEAQSGDEFIDMVGTMQVGGSDGYVLTRLKEFDIQIFNNFKVKGQPDKKYSRTCQKDNQPYPITDDKMAEIKEYYKNKPPYGFKNSIKYGSDSNKQYNLICPKYICRKSQIPLIDDKAKCPDKGDEKIYVAKEPYVYLKKDPFLESPKDKKLFEIPCCGNKEVTDSDKKTKSIQISQKSFYREVPKIVNNFAPKKFDDKEIIYSTLGSTISVGKYFFVSMNIAGNNMSVDPLMDTIAYCTYLNNKRGLVNHIKKILTPSIFLSLENGAVFTAFKDDAPVREEGALKWCQKDPAFMKVFNIGHSALPNWVLTLYGAYLKYINYLEYNDEKSPYLIFDLLRHLGVFLTLWEYNKNKDNAVMAVDLLCPYYRSAESIAKSTKKIIMVGKNADQYEAIVVYYSKISNKLKVKKETVVDDLATEKTKEVPEKIETADGITYARLDLTEDLAKLVKSCPAVEGENEVELYLPKFLEQRKGAWEGILDLGLRLVYIRTSANAKWASLGVPIPIGYLTEYIDGGVARLYFQEEATRMPGSPTFAPITAVHKPKIMVSNRSKYINEIYEKEKNKQLFWYKFQHTFASWLYRNYDLDAVKKALRRAKTRSERVQRLYDVIKKYVQMPMNVKEVRRDFKKILAHADAIKAAGDPAAEWISPHATADSVQASFKNMTDVDQRRLRPLYEKAMAIFKLRARLQSMQRIADADMSDKEYKRMLQIGIEELPVASKHSLLRWLRDHQALDRYPFFSLEIRETPREYIFSQGAVEEGLVYAKKISGVKTIIKEIAI